jgi:hypothetical protein
MRCHEAGWADNRMSFDLGVWDAQRSLTVVEAGDLYLKVCNQEWVPIEENLRQKHSIRNCAASTLRSTRYPTIRWMVVPSLATMIDRGCTSWWQFPMDRKQIPWLNMWLTLPKSMVSPVTIRKGRIFTCHRI